MSKAAPRWPVGLIAMGLLLWIVHLFLPVLERTDPKPGWVQIFLIFFPAGWLLLATHVLFFVAMGACALRRWPMALYTIVPAAALLFLMPPGPITYPGVAVLWSAYLVVFFCATAGFYRGEAGSHLT